MNTISFIAILFFIIILILLSLVMIIADPLMKIHAFFNYITHNVKERDLNDHTSSLIQLLFVPLPVAGYFHFYFIRTYH